MKLEYIHTYTLTIRLHNFSLHVRLLHDVLLFIQRVWHLLTFTYEYILFFTCIKLIVDLGMHYTSMCCAHVFLSRICIYTASILACALRMHAYMHKLLWMHSCSIFTCAHWHGLLTFSQRSVLWVRFLVWLQGPAQHARPGSTEPSWRQLRAPMWGIAKLHNIALFAGGFNTLILYIYIYIYIKQFAFKLSAKVLSGRAFERYGRIDFFSLTGFRTETLF